MAEASTTGIPSPAHAGVRPDRPCDSCRRRKTRCVLNAESPTTCVLCTFHNQNCTFLEDAVPRRRKVPTSPRDDGSVGSRQSRGSTSQVQRRHSETVVSTVPIVEDYANLRSASLLKKTLGLQNHRHARYIGQTGIQDSTLLSLRPYDNIRNESAAGSTSFRQIAPHHYFIQHADTDQPDAALDMEDCDEIERTVAPHGHALIRLYFRIVHPTYPILHKKVYLEKYGRSHREFSPPLLAAVYLLAHNWWLYSAELATIDKPDISQLERLALRALWRISRRAKLSTVQAGLLLSQKPSIASWPLTSLIVGMAQDLGLHLDCSNWRIPGWEQGLRKRLAWAVFMQDSWSALIYGRPPLLAMSNWGPQAVVSSDFPESAADENDEEGSTEVEKGRTLFSAMITVTRILFEVLDNMYSLRAEAEVNNSGNQIEAVLGQAKPMQLKLKAWYSRMPEPLRIDSPTKVGKLDSIGYLHLAYYAIEITIHRRVVRCLSNKTDPFLIQVCRTAAKSRLMSAMEFFDRLKPEHLQSFWYFASNFNFALIGSFAGLCLATSISQEEAAFYQERLQKYRWTLRVWSTGVEFLKQVSELVAAVVEPVTSISSTSLATTPRNLSFPLLQYQQEDAEDDVVEDFEPASIHHFFPDFTSLDAFPDDASMHTM